MFGGCAASLRLRFLPTLAFSVGVLFLAPRSARAFLQLFTCRRSMRYSTVFFAHAGQMRCLSHEQHSYLLLPCVLLPHDPLHTRPSMSSCFSFFFSAAAISLWSHRVALSALAVAAVGLSCSTFVRASAFFLSSFFRASSSNLFRCRRASPDLGPVCPSFSRLASASRWPATSASVRPARPH